MADPFHPFRRPIDAVMRRAWEELDALGVLEAFAQVALKRLKNHETIVGDRIHP